MKRTTPNSPAKNPKPSKLRSTVGGLSAAESRATDGPPPAPTVLSKAVNLQKHTPDVSMLNPDDPDWEDEDVVEIPETDFDDAKRSRARQNASQNVDEYETDSDNGDVPPPAMKKLTRSRARKNAKNVDNDTSENEIDPVMLRMRHRRRRNPSVAVLARMRTRIRARVPRARPRGTRA
ncbi:hypothetical protein RSOL_403040 [Rhizoctonia solani AG-3 Rhs1AP]|uniref:Uncharacterized protein n=1 Tax=Rhizoctonia solani AG-3 Rhs1AP TaxID=1086054 RepID=X8JFA5_9AGAM|nr:hypothetical protein RSOL_403040 [Rhizoctonia solani AG-3 Rhs1AP]